MKTLAIILSIYVTLLAAMPCCVFDNCPDDKASVEQTSPKNHDQGDEDGCGTCSPFFNCSTCNASFVAATLTTFDFITTCSINHFQSHYASAVIASTSGKIWQPPKFA